MPKSAQAILSGLRLFLSRTAEYLHAASKDLLTGALNRRSFMTRANGLFTLLAQSGRVCSVIVLDIDNLRTVNRKYGRRIGDYVLKQSSNRIAHALRPQDIFGRIGSDEFAVLLSDEVLADAILLADRLRLTVESISIMPGDSSMHHLSASVGVSTVSPETTTVLGALQVALEAMDKAKAAGGNQVHAGLQEQSSKWPPN